LLQERSPDLSTDPAVAQAMISSMGASSQSFQQARLLMSLELASSISRSLIVIVVFWAMLLFFGFGVLSRLNATSFGARAFGSFAVAERNLPDPSLSRASFAFRPPRSK
jgi:hypothetical protein